MWVATWCWMAAKAVWCHLDDPRGWEAPSPRFCNSLPRVPNWILTRSCSQWKGPLQAFSSLRGNVPDEIGSHMHRPVLPQLERFWVFPQLHSCLCGPPNLCSHLICSSVSPSPPSPGNLSKYSCLHLDFVFTWLVNTSHVTPECEAEVELKIGIWELQQFSKPWNYINGAGSRKKRQGAQEGNFRVPLAFTNQWMSGI